MKTLIRSISLLIFMVFFLVNISIIDTNKGKRISFVKESEAGIVGGNKIPCYKNYTCLYVQYLIVHCSGCNDIYVATRSNLSKCTQAGTANPS